MSIKIPFLVTWFAAITSIAAVPDCDGVIMARGEAKLSVPPDIVRISLQIELESGSFSDAKRAGDEIRRRLEEAETGLPGGIRVSVEYDFGLLSQRRLSWTKGRKLEYRFVILLGDMPQVGVRDIVLEAIDLSLSVDQSMAVQGIEVDLSQERAIELKENALRDAVADAIRSAQAIASVAGLKIDRVRRVFPRAGDGTMYGENLRLDGGNINQMIVFRKKFTIDAGIEEIESTADIVAEVCAAGP